jgi:acetyl esterase/lipase
MRALVAYYGIMDLSFVRHPDPAQRLLSDEDVPEFSPRAYLRDGRPLPPLLVARAGRDRPQLNESIDAFVADAIAAGASIDLLTHPNGQHGFDSRDDDDRSREIITATLDFLTRRLRPS